MKKNKSAPRPALTNSRKAIRKQKRQQKKVHRQEHYLKKKNTQEQPKYTPGRFVKRPAASPEPETEVKKKKQKVQQSPQDILKRERQKEQNEVKRLTSQMEEQRRKMLLQANEEEDRIIKKLEKQLGLNKTKNKNNFFAEDGLDYVLEVCDRKNTEQIVAAEKHLADVEAGSDFEDDLAAVTGKKIDKRKDKVNKKGNIKGNNSIDESDEGSNDDEEISDDEEEISDDEPGENEEIDDELSGDEMEGDDDVSEGDIDDFSEYSDDAPEEKPTKSTKSKSKKAEIQEKSSKNNQLAESKKTSKERVVSEEDLSKVFSDDEVSHLSGDDDDDIEGFSGDEIDKENSDEKPAEKKEKPDVWEDIYGRKRDKEGNIIKEEKGVYIPPHLRNKDSASDKELAQLKRQIKSVLNKLAGTNLHWACTTIENLYSSNSRHSVNSALSQLWFEAAVAVSATPDRMVAENAALVSVLHANVATEIGAHFLQELAERFDEMMRTPQPVEDKRLDNLISCLSHLYCFKIYQASLLYDILYRLLEELTEKNIGSVLVALRCVGGVLRKEEPAALRSFIQHAQGRAAGSAGDAAAGSRIKFLLEVLMAVKNNNLTKIPNYDPTYVEQLKKMTKTIIRKGYYVTPLNIRLEDLLKAEERGKWWIVGSAWEGSRPLPETKAVAQPAVSQQLLELARTQRMNTDVRRSIFCVIMSAEDYMDAFEKLQHLGLRGQQDREISHVLAACCLQEKSYNPYYAVLARQLCATDRKYQLAIQYTLWDKIKDLENLTKQNISNLAQFIVHLVMEKSLPLSVLKIIEFSDLNKRAVRFMRQILLSIIMNEDLQSSLEVFHRISKAPKLHMFRESLKLFIQHFLVKNAGKSEVISENEMATLKERTAEVNKILTMYESKLLL